ncbi:MAG: RDD family protein [Akkermansiaceae bacterium]|nr:RDD family protein [Akkermansiaceae bacterium]
MEIPEEAKKKVKEVVPDEDEVKAGDIAPFNTRIIAALIDYGAIIIASLVLMKILPGFLSSVVSLASLGYILTKDSLPFLGGQSIGKKVMKLRAVTADGAPLTGNWEKGILRNAFLIIAPVELVVLLLREEKPEKGRRLGDDFAKTKVIVEAEPVVPEA